MARTTVTGAQVGDGEIKTVDLADLAVTSAKIANLTITDAQIALENKDGAATTASMRTLGTAALQAAAGNDARLSDARAPLAHNHAWSTITATPTTLANYGITDAEYMQPVNTIRNNLGNPTAAEKALFHGQFSNKLRFIPATSQEESADGSTWAVSTRASTNQLGDVMLGEGQTGGIAAIPSLAVSGQGHYRLTWDNASSGVGNVFLSNLYIYNSTNGNNVTFKIEKHAIDTSTWSLTSSGTISNWPGHVNLPHDNITFSTNGGQYNKVRVTFSISSASNTNSFDIYAIEWFGGYPAGKRNVESYDRLKNVTFPATITATSLASTIATGTAPLTVVSTTLVSNLNADLVDGFHVATSASPSSVVARDSNGYIYGVYLNSSRGDESSAAASYIYDTGDGWMRKKTLASTRTEIVTKAAVDAVIPNLITGTGTLNYVSKFIAAGTLGNSSIIDNGTAVLIGTTTDNAIDKLQITGSVNITADSKINGISIGRGTGTGSNNVRVGDSALANNTGGFINAAIGPLSLAQNAGGYANVGVGFAAIYSNTSGNRNIGIGPNSLYYQTTGNANIAVGENSLSNKASGSNNVAIGADSGRYLLNKSTTATILNNSLMIGHNTSPLADNQTNQIVIGFNASGLGSNTTILGNSSTVTTGIYGNLLLGTTTDNAVDKLQITGSANISVDSKINGVSVGKGAGNVASNTRLGDGALSSNTTGGNNSAFGQFSLLSNTTGAGNVASGQYSLYFNTTGGANTAAGFASLMYNTTASNNSAFGYGSLQRNTTGANNSALGFNSLSANTIGNGSVAIGHGSLQSNTTGGSNTAVGYGSLFNNTTAASNTALGYSALYFNTTGASNTAVGNSALFNNTTGVSNSALGVSALQSNTTGGYNSAFGHNALLSNTTASSNSAFGFGALRSNTEGSGNSAVGFYSLFNNTTGGGNTAVGQSSLQSNTIGTGSSALGSGALQNSTTGSGNSALGQQSLYTNTTGGNNTAVGQQSLYGNTTGNGNSAVGHGSLQSNTTGSGHSAIGQYSLFNNTTGLNNSAHGVSSLRFNTTGGNNSAIGQGSGCFIADKTTSATILNNSTLVGYNTSPLADNQTNQTVIGYNATGLGSNTTVLGNSAVITTAIYGDLLLGTTTTNNSVLNVQGSKSAVSAIARGVYIAPVLTATANNDVLVGLDIAPIFTIGTFTGIKSYDLRIGSIIPRAAATYSIGSSSASFLELYANNIYSAGSNLTLAAAAGNSIAFVTGATESARLFATTGNFTLQNGGTFTDAGYRLDVTGTTRLNGNTTINGKLDVAGSVRIADDVAVASASNVGAIRYRESATTSYSEMCMRTGATAYAWIVQVENNW